MFGRWFAALGNYQREPWLVHLVDKLLKGGMYASDVLPLLDAKRYPFSLTEPPKYVRAVLYYYDFTRLNQSWVQQKGIDPKLVILNDTSDQALYPWWSRQEVGEYLPVLEQSNPSVSSFLSGYHLPSREPQSIEEKQRYCLATAETSQNGPLLSLLQRIICSCITIRMRNTP